MTTETLSAHQIILPNSNALHDTLKTLPVIPTYKVREFIKQVSEDLDTFFHDGDCKTCKRENCLIDMNSDCIKCKIAFRAGKELSNG